jgi:hypothetical protein
MEKEVNFETVNVIENALNSKPVFAYLSNLATSTDYSLEMQWKSTGYLTSLHLIEKE